LLIAYLKEFKPLGIGSKFGVRVDEDMKIVWVADTYKKYIYEIQSFIKRERLKIITNAY
jgi:hypothetical protein